MNRKIYILLFSYKYMEYKPLTDYQKQILKAALNYNSDTDYNNSIGRSLADRLRQAFGEITPKTTTLNEKKLKFYNAFVSIKPQALYNSKKTRQFKRLFSRLKQEGYKGPDDKGMKNYNKMNWTEIWDYYSEIRKDLDIFR